MSTTTVPTSRDMADAMIDLRTGKITPDDFRAMMRASREARTEDEHERAKFGAFAIDVQRYGS